LRDNLGGVQAQIAATLIAAYMDGASEPRWHLHAEGSRRTDEPWNLWSRYLHQNGTGTQRIGELRKPEELVSSLTTGGASILGQGTRVASGAGDLFSTASHSWPLFVCVYCTVLRLCGVGVFVSFFFYPKNVSMEYSVSVLRSFCC